MKKSELYGVIGSAFFCGIVLLLLLLIIMPGKQTPEDEGIIVSFGNSFDGGGQNQATNVQASQPALPQSTPQPVQQRSNEDILTQEDNSLAIARQEEERRKKEQQVIEQKRREEEQRLTEQKRREEEARIAEQKRREEEARIAEQKRKQEATEKANALDNMFGGGTNGAGSGSNEGENQQGNPVGKGSSEGNSYSLDGRRVIGKLITPSYNRNIQKGVIVVGIRVSKNGDVTDAWIEKGTDISERDIRDITLQAARKTKFSDGKDIAVGTITYYLIPN